MNINKTNKKRQNYSGHVLLNLTMWNPPQCANCFIHNEPC